MSGRWRIAGPGIGPFRTTLASGRIGASRRRRRSGPAWSRRFGTLWYWLLGVWALETAFWLVYGLVMLTVAIAAAVSKHHEKAATASGSAPTT